MPSLGCQAFPRTEHSCRVSTLAAAADTGERLLNHRPGRRKDKCGGGRSACCGLRASRARGGGYYHSPSLLPIPSSCLPSSLLDSPPTVVSRSYGGQKGCGVCVRSAGCAHLPWSASHYAAWRSLSLPQEPWGGGWGECEMRVNRAAGGGGTGGSRTSTGFSGLYAMKYSLSKL